MFSLNYKFMNLDSLVTAMAGLKYQIYVVRNFELALFVISQVSLS